MNYDSMKVSDLIAECKAKNIKGYSGKKKDYIINLLKGENSSVNKELTSKQKKGQFYTVNNSYILEGLDFPIYNKKIIEPFAGRGDLINWLKEKGNKFIVESYDIDPKGEGILKRDTLLNPPEYKDKWIITNPPYLARNKCSDKTIFDKYNTNDLYKCFITSLTSQKDKCAGGIFIIPVGFFLSPRDVDVRCRDEFLSKYKITRVKYFEEDVFPDTSTTVVAFSFIKSEVELKEQCIEWVLLPSGEKRKFKLSKKNDWIIGGDIYNLDIPDNIKVRRWVEEEKYRTKLQEGEQITNLTLHGLDSGTEEGRIHLEYKEGYIYPSKDTSRSYATLCIKGKTLSSEEQIEIAKRFNEFIEKKRKETWSLFLPQFRESKEYARKRIPFELAYRIVLHLLLDLNI